MHKLIKLILNDVIFCRNFKTFLDGSSFTFFDAYSLLVTNCSVPHPANIGPFFPFRVIQYITSAKKEYIFSDPSIKSPKKVFQFQQLNQDREDEEMIMEFFKALNIPIKITNGLTEKSGIKWFQRNEGYRTALETAKHNVWDNKGIIISQSDSKWWGMLYFNIEYRSQIESELTRLGIKYEMVVYNEL